MFNSISSIAKEIDDNWRNKEICVTQYETEVKKAKGGHSAAILGLKFYNQNYLISSSCDKQIIVRNTEDGEIIQILRHHTDNVMDIALKDNTLITASKDCSLAVWTIISPKIFDRQISLRHENSVNVVDLNEKYIASGSTDTTIKLWNRSTFRIHSTLTGHIRGITCLKYENNIIVSGSADQTIRIWKVDTLCCLKELKDHYEMVRSITFNEKYIISGSKNEKIKIWDMVACLDPTSNPRELCFRTLNASNGLILKIKMDDHKILSSANDGKIKIWDFWKTDDEYHN
ncbi:F-box/WD repeat-containing protein 1A-like [Leptopilina heterotoma]|uniref:F-box/WD repeat-containing protein 1A-like n=1 Tax=Leptopilina heterotoma TaxID=63436 RepID=UPI001CAA0F78|nr:F-box/WD repeat-containing protein 1A-like [Leptopilina heterotoma]XP_043482769.1 F-box/WD repeat-containing protein 1A-like [Leptopilina heterotoma]